MFLRLPPPSRRLATALGSIALAIGPTTKATAQQWSVDPSFAPTLYHEDDVTRALQATSDNKGGYYVIGGNNRAGTLYSVEVPTDPFTHVDGEPAAGVVHLSADGSLDRDFHFTIPPEIHLSGLPLVTPGRTGFWLKCYRNTVPTNAYPRGQIWSLRYFQGDGRLDETTATIELGGTLIQAAARHDGGLVIWGDFTELAGQPHRDIAIVAPDGSLPPFTVPWELNGFRIASVAATPNGDILVSGTRVLPGTTRYEILQLDASGATDVAFAAKTAISAQGAHRILAVLPDGRFYTKLTAVHRFQADGTVDRTWQPIWSDGASVRDIQPLADGRVLLRSDSGVELRAVDGTLITTLAQLPGALDVADLLATDGTDTALVLQGHVASWPHSGYFELAGIPVERFIDARLAQWSLTGATLTDLPHAFTAQRESIVNQLKIDQLGRILVAGDFTQCDGQRRPGLARLLPNGTLDPTFAPPANLRPVLPLDDGSWIALQGDYESFEGNPAPIATLRPVHVRADGAVDPGFHPPTIAQDATRNFVVSSIRWWGQRASGDLLISAVGLDPARLNQIAFAWIDPSTGAVRTLLPVTFPLLSLQSIPPTDPFESITMARCTPSGRVVVISFDEISELLITREHPHFTWFDASGAVDPARAARLTAYDLVGDNPPAVNDAGDVLLTLNAPVNPLSGRKHLVIDEQDQIHVWDDDEPIFLPLPVAVDNHGWLGARLLTDERGQFDSGFYTDPRYSPGLRDGRNNDIGYYTAGVRDVFGRLWLGGRFDTVDGRPRPGLVRLLNTDGTVRLTNLSARSEVSATTPQFVGFVLGGSDPETVLIRAIGEGLRPYWSDALDATPLLASPHLTLHFADGTASPMSPSPATDPTIAEVANRVGAYPLPELPDDSTDTYVYGAALHTLLAPAPHTAMVSSADGTAGVALLEVYDDAESPDGANLRNLSLSGAVGTGDRTMVAGFVIQGNRSAKLLLRGIGPGLHDFGVDDAVHDPRITVFAGPETLATSDDWIANTDMNLATVAAGAFTLTTGSKDAALLVDLPPGAYTLQLETTDEDRGEAMLEIYLLEPAP